MDVYDFIDLCLIVHKLKVFNNVQHLEPQQLRIHNQLFRNPYPGGMKLNKLESSYSWKTFNAGARTAVNRDNQYSVYSVGTGMSLKRYSFKWIPESKSNVSQNGSFTGEFIKTWKRNKN